MSLGFPGFRPDGAGRQPRVPPVTCENCGTHRHLTIRSMTDLPGYPAGWYPSSGFNGGHGTLIGYYNVGTQARRFGAMHPDKRLARALELGAQVHGPVYTRDVRASFSVDWASVEHSEGAWTKWPSQTDPRYKELLKPAGNIYFAGSHLSHALSWQHGAMVSARATVMSLHSRVTSP
jgi:monoamine oxidase